MMFRASNVSSSMAIVLLFAFVPALDSLLLFYVFAYGGSSKLCPFGYKGRDNDTVVEAQCGNNITVKTCIYLQNIQPSGG